MRVQRDIITAALLLSALAVSGAAAQDPANATPPAGGATTPPPRDEPPKAPPNDAAAPRTAHGIYIRAGLGFGGMGNDVVGSQQNATGENPEGTITGMGVMSEATFGVALSSQWVLGLGVYNGLILVSDYNQIHGEEIPANLQEPESFTVAGLFGDWHFAPELGLHGQAGIGMALLSSRRFSVEEPGNHIEEGSSMAVGPGVTLGLGADFWATESWALGAVARLTAGAAIEKEAGRKYVHAVFTPALLMTVCYNE